MSPDSCLSCVGPPILRDRQTMPSQSDSLCRRAPLDPLVFERRASAFAFVASLALVRHTCLCEAGGVFHVTSVTWNSNGSQLLCGWHVPTLGLTRVRSCAPLSLRGFLRLRCFAFCLVAQQRSKERAAKVVTRLEEYAVALPSRSLYILCRCYSFRCRSYLCRCMCVYSSLPAQPSSYGLRVRSFAICF